MATDHCADDIGSAIDKRQMEVVAPGNKTESNSETACDETEKSEGSSGMPEIESN